MAKTHSNSSAQDSLTPPPRPPETQTLDRPSESDTNPLVRQSIEDSLAGLSMEDHYRTKRDSIRAWVAEQECRIENEIIRAIYSGKTDSLKPNSYDSITIGDHYVCVFHRDDEIDPKYRTWDWHGHVMRYDEEDGYTSEHIYGHHHEKLSWYDDDYEEEYEEWTEDFAFPWSSRRT
ncbi:hypothetical protein NL676_018387 [Syzygium grande]|nr:hypothetical protein NL676_018387 [Syzygium grande]